LDPLPTGHVTQSIHGELLPFNLSRCNFEALYRPNGASYTHGYNGPPIGNHICRVQWSPFAASIFGLRSYFRPFGPQLGLQPQFSVLN